MIETRKLGGLTVSDICLGTMTFGKDTPKDEALAQMDRAIAAGITFWDTAEMYPVNPAAAETYGLTEEIIGEWLASRGRRDEVRIATKASGPNGGHTRGGIQADSPVHADAIGAGGGQLVHVLARALAEQDQRGALCPVTALQFLRDALQVKIEGPHIADKYLLDNVVSSGERFGMTGVRNFGPDRWLDEGDQVSIGDLTFDILHCPGHSPGSVVFFNKELRFAHVGDVLFAGSVGRTDLPGGSHPTLIQSITQKLLPLGDDVGFICGHGAGSSIGQERMTNPFLTGEM